MGIQGLLPVLKSIQQKVHLRDFQGQTLAVDGYAWLHKGAFSCSLDLYLGNKTHKFVDYCLVKIKMMRYFGVEPYIVLDGGPLPMKQKTETERKKRRLEMKQKGEDFLKAGNKKKAEECFQQCTDITPEMALQLIQVLKRENVQFVVAPYEADAQMAFLEKQGIVQGILTEDSDLLVFGCKKVLYKLDKEGNALLLEIENLSKVKEMNMNGWSMKEFRQMCILSGCDYLQNIHGMGLKTAHKMLRKYKTVERVVRIASYTNHWPVPETYLKDFRLAELTFLHQRVFNVQTQKLDCLSPVEESLQNGDDLNEILFYIGPEMENDLAVGISKGELDPLTKQPFIDLNKENIINQIKNEKITLKPNLAPLKPLNFNEPLPLQQKFSFSGLIDSTKAMFSSSSSSQSIATEKKKLFKQLLSKSDSKSQIRKTRDGKSVVGNQPLISSFAFKSKTAAPTRSPLKKKLKNSPPQPPPVQEAKQTSQYFNNNQDNEEEKEKENISHQQKISTILNIEQKSTTERKSLFSKFTYQQVDLKSILQKNHKNANHTLQSLMEQKQNSE